MVTGLWSSVWWRVKGEFGERWVAVAAGALAALLAVLGWVEVTIHSTDIDLPRLLQLTAALTGAVILASFVVAGVRMWLYHYQVPEAIAERGVLTFIRTLLALGLIGITFGVFIHGGRFLHLDILLKLFGVGKGG